MLIDIPTRLKNIEKPIRRITAKEAALEIEKNQGLLLDVREASEVAEKPVNKATAIPRGILEMKMLALVKEADRHIYIHCASGVRASLAAEQLMLMGYEQVSVVTCAVDDIIAAVTD